MKKINLFLAVFLAGSLLLISSAVRAQSTDSITLDDPDITSSSNSTTADTTKTNDSATSDAGVPDTGFAPTHNKALASTSVFIIGSVLGGALGYGIIKFRKKV